jgi:hypothetical protein
MLHDYTRLAVARRFPRILTFLHLPNHELKGLLYVLVVSRARFGPCAFEFGGEGAAVVGRDLSLLRAEVRLVAYDDEGDILGGLADAS